MEKKSTWKEVKGVDVQSVIIGISILFSVLSAVFGCEVLSFSNAMVLAFYLIMAGMSKDLKELCNGLVEEYEREY